MLPRVQDCIPYLMVALECDGSKHQLKSVVMRLNVAENVLTIDVNWREGQ